MCAKCNAGMLFTNPNPVFASAAKQSTSQTTRCPTMDCHVATLLAMTEARLCELQPRLCVLVLKLIFDFLTIQKIFNKLHNSILFPLKRRDYLHLNRSSQLPYYRICNRSTITYAGCVANCITSCNTSQVFTISASVKVGCTINIKLVSPNSRATHIGSAGR